MAAITAEKWRQKKRVFYLGGLHKQGQKVITMMVAQTQLSMPAEIGGVMEVEDWLARELAEKFQVQGNPCFTLNVRLAETIKNGSARMIGGVVVQTIEMSDEEILARAEAIRAGKADKKASKSDTKGIKEQLEQAQADLDKELA